MLSVAHTKVWACLGFSFRLSESTLRPACSELHHWLGCASVLILCVSSGVAPVAQILQCLFRRIRDGQFLHLSLHHCLSQDWSAQLHLVSKGALLTVFAFFRLTEVWPFKVCLPDKWLEGFALRSAMLCSAESSTVFAASRSLFVPLSCSALFCRGLVLDNLTDI